MHFIDGKSLAAKIRAEIKEEIASSNLQPTLAILLVGDDPASRLYVSLKEKAASEVGIKTLTERKDASVTDDELVQLIKDWNEDSTIHGILVQFPLPSNHDQDRVMGAVDPKKDADGFHPVNRAALLAGHATIIPPVHEGILRLIGTTPLRIHGAKASLIMNSGIFAEPLKRLLSIGGAGVEIMQPDELDYRTLSDSDLVVVAVGRPNFLNISMTKPDAVIIDVGTNKTPDGKVRGDVDIDSYQHATAWITPVPGGVGPMTIAQLLKNVVNLAKTTDRKS
jgi:methylenetetrahydrofolate dehydrogenase (NADP+) / methenyltetrahydrofolate cyclohydrolase